MAWYNSSGPETDVVISSRIRFARNLAGYPFTSRLNEQTAREVIGLASAALTGADNKYKVIDFTNLTPAEARAFVENHSVSPEFIESKLPHALLSATKRGGGNALRGRPHKTAGYPPGLALREAYEKACGLTTGSASPRTSPGTKTSAIDALSTNLGTGMRASVMMFCRR